MRKLLLAIALVILSASSCTLYEDGSFELDNGVTGCWYALPGSTCGTDGYSHGGNGFVWSTSVERAQYRQFND